jgi:hypothetical protein
MARGVSLSALWRCTLRSDSCLAVKAISIQELPPPDDADGRDRFEATKLALTIWFQAIYMISQAKTGLSALALKRQIGISYLTSWMIHHELMHAMRQRDDHYLLGGLVQIDDAYLGGELSWGEAGRGSENMVHFVAAEEFNEK